MVYVRLVPCRVSFCSSVGGDAVAMLAVVSRAWCVVVGMALTIRAENDGELLATPNECELLSAYAKLVWEV